MNFTISDCMSRINQALNFPSLSYEDVYHFFDQAISELNSTLRISLPSVTEMRHENTQHISEHPNCVFFKDSFEIEIPDSKSASGVYYYITDDTSAYRNNTLRILRGTDWNNDGDWEDVDSAFACVATTEGVQFYTAAVVGHSVAYWAPISGTVVDFSLTKYLPVDWINLFVIPYVCFKFSVRNGDSGALFSDEFTQGFQQLQVSYNIPTKVVLSTVAHLPAYKEIAEKNLNNLGMQVYTRAITEDMKTPNGVPKTYYSTFENGGWGI